MPDRLHILVVDDEPAIREGCRRALSGLDDEVDTCADGQQALQQLERQTYHIVLLDLLLPVMDGFMLLDWLKQNRPETQVIVVSGFATVQKAVEAMQRGACDFLAKPFTPEYLRLVVRRAADRLSLAAEASRLRREKAADLHAILQEQTRLKTLVDCIEGAVLLTNREGKLILHNPSTIKLFNLPADAAGKPLSQLIPHPAVGDMIEQVYSRFGPVTREFAPGTLSAQHLRACCAPVHTATGKIFGAVTIFEDIGAQKKLEQLRADFVAVLAHELRAPLAAIMQMIHSVRRSQDEGRRQHYLERIRERCEGLLRLIENLLALSRLEAAAAPLRLVPEAGERLLQEAVETIRPRAEEKKLRLEVREAAEPWWVEADHDQLLRVLVNLLDNAVKYTPAEGSIFVEVDLQPKTVTVSVRDTGIGIEPEHLPHLFERFYRVPGAQTRGIGGSGLGLALCKRLAEMHGGAITVASQPGRGSTFSLVLPRSGLPTQAQDQ